MRTQKLNVMFSESEIDQVRQKAKPSHISHFVRRRLGLPLPTMGRPTAESTVRNNLKKKT